MDLILAKPRGFCAGVVRAIDIVKIALEVHGPPVYVFHEIVHNRHVVDELGAQGAVFVDDIGDIPHGAVTIFSAHGVSNAIVAQAQARRLDIIDATCPLVTKVHLQAQRYSQRGYAIVIIGHSGHEEVEGTMGSVDGPVHLVSKPEDVDTLEVTDPDRLAYVTQTTLSLDDTREVISALQTRFPNILGPDLKDICYATQNRQNAVRELARQVDLLLVVGARNSSNSNRLREVGQSYSVPAYLIEDQNDLEQGWFEDVSRVGITAGASAPEVLVRRVIERVRSFGAVSVTEMEGLRETTTFRLPSVLRSKRGGQNATA